MIRFVPIISAVLFSSAMVSCKKGNYPPAVPLQENIRSKEEREPLLPNELLENEGFFIDVNYPPGSAKMNFKLFKASPNRTEVRLGVIEESKQYFVLSKFLENNSDFILTVEYTTVSRNAAFQLSIKGILSLKSPAALNLPDYLFTTESIGVRTEVLKIRKGNLKFAFFPI